MSTDVNKYNHIVKDLEPGPGNPRNSEGAFIGSPDGRSIMFIYSKFNSGTGNDDDPAGLAQICSGDGGETWTDAESVITAADDNAQNIMSVSLIRMQNGDIGLIYFIRYGFDNGKAYIRRSSDEGQTWSKASCCVPAEGYYVTNNDRVIRLKSGRLLLPTGYHRTFINKAGNSKTSDRRSMAIYFYSDDDGATWSESNICAINSRHTKSGLQEPGAIELENGMLYGWARTDMGFQYEMLSGDGGKTWTTPEPSVFTSPRSPMSIKRDPVSGNLLAVWNPVPHYQTRVIKGVSDRNPLVCAVSRNDGLTWGKPVVLEDDALSGFCYTAIHFTGDSLLLAYCAGGPADKGCLNRLRVRKMSNPCL